MGHRISFDGKFTKDFRGLISEQEVRDVVDMFYKHDEGKFVFTAERGPNGQRGEHDWNGLTRTHVINLSRDNITKGFNLKQRMGGNGPAPTLKMAVVMVLTHELQHANQIHDHGHGDRNFYGVRNTSRVRYNRRPCERDARRFVDDNIHVIAEFVGHQMPTRRSRGPRNMDQDNELLDIAAVLGENEKVTLKDILDELRSSGINNPKNVERMIGILLAQGIKVD